MQSRPLPGKTILRPFGTSIFGEMTALAQRHKAVNLSQGFPDFDGPAFVKDAAIHAILNGPNQYARSMGLPELTEAIAAKVYRQCGIALDPQKQVGVYSGATEGLFATMMGLLEPGDEVILFQPCFDSYHPSIAMAGGKARFCTLYWPDFHFDQEELSALFNPRTRLILINTPHNPSGKMFTESELAFIANLCIRNNVIAITDEVYEHITFDAAHISIASLPGMAERTLTISSTGKTFSLTGWKIGYAWGPDELISSVQAAHQFITFATASPLQKAMASALATDGAYYSVLQNDYLKRRKLLSDLLENAGFTIALPAGAYYIMADIAPFGFADDLSFARYLIEEIGVACIPTASFYGNPIANERHLVRFAFCKEESTLEEAGKRLAKLKKTG